MKRYVLLLLTALLTSCVTLPPNPPQTVSWQQQSAKLAHINQWKLNGALSIKTKKDRITAEIIWKQQDRYHYDIRFFGPFGVNSAQIIGTPKQITLEKENQRYYAKNADTLLMQYMGWELPLENLYYWIRGLPVPNVPAKQLFSAEGQLTRLEQTGWIIQYLSYDTSLRLSLPTKITLQNRYFSARIVIKRWFLVDS